MNYDALKKHEILDPVDRASEIIFGLIMALTITGSFSVANAGQTEIQSMLYSALGCNVAWGVIDGIMFMLSNVIDRTRQLAVVESLRLNQPPSETRATLEESFPTWMAGVLTDSNIESLRSRLLSARLPPNHGKLKWTDFKGALVVFMWVLMATVPATLPFVFIQNASVAMRVSNLMAMGLLFIVGHRLGKFAHHSPWKMGISMLILGSVLVGLTIALGG